MTRLLLIRHAEPEEAVRGRCYGSLDVGLSDAGRAGAERLGTELAGLALAAVYTSPARRARDTATAVAEPHGLEPQLDDGLRELDFGAFEGRTYDELAAAEPELYRRWMEAPASVRFPGGEGYADLRARALRALGAVRDAHPGATVAVVAHDGVVRAQVADCLGIPDEALFRFDLGHARVSVVDWLDGVPVVRLVNGTADAAPRTGP